MLRFYLIVPLASAWHTKRNTRKGARLTNLVNGKKQQIASYKREQRASVKQEGLDVEKKEVPTFVEGGNSRKASQIAMSTPPPQPSYVHRTPTFFEWFPLAVLLGFGFLVYIRELFCKPDDKNKDL